MTERFSNQAVTTLSAAIATTTATSCSIIDATAFPTSGDFRIKIDGEILLVTGVAGATFTITRGMEGTTPATHAAGATVIHLLTKGGLEARVANRFVSDLYANKPAAGVKGRLFLPTDGLFLEYDDGSAWHKYGPCRRLKAPPQTGWTWVNQGNATATFTGSAVLVEDPDLDSNSPEYRLLVRPLSSGATRLVAALSFNGISSASPRIGFCMRNPTDEDFTLWGLYHGTTYASYLQFAHYSGPTTVENDPTFNGRVVPPQNLFWFKFDWSGDDKYYYFSMDGLNWIKWQSLSFYQYNAPSQFGVYIDPRENTGKVALSLVHWEEF